MLKAFARALLVIVIANPSVLWADDRIYWSDSFSQGVKSANLDGSSAVNIATGKVFGIALDLGAQKIYYADDTFHRISRRNLDGTGFEVLLEGPPAQVYGMALHAGKLYWADGHSGTGPGTISRCNLDGTEFQDLVTTVSEPFGIAIDRVTGKIYWTDALDKKLQRSNLDGSNVEDLLDAADGLVGPHGIALDLDAGKMYWADNIWVKRANLDGSSLEIIVSNLSTPLGIALDVPRGKVYWTEAGSTDLISRSNLDGSGREDLFESGGGSPTFLALDVPLVPVPTVSQWGVLHLALMLLLLGTLKLKNSFNNSAGSASPRLSP